MTEALIENETEENIGETAEQDAIAEDISSPTPEPSGDHDNVEKQPEEDTTPAEKAKSIKVPATQQDRLNYLVSLSRQIGQQLQSIGKEYWEADHRLTLTAVTSKNLYFWKTDPFFVSQLPLNSSDDNEHILQLRISEELCGHFLEQSLGQGNNSQPFKLSSSTVLESSILGGYAKGLVKTFLETIVDPPKIKRHKGDSSLIHLLWTVSATTDAPNIPDGKIILTLPTAAINWKQSLPENNPTPVPFHRYQHGHSKAQLFIGQTRSPLEDIQNLEVGDTVVLENSHSQQLYLMNTTTGEKHAFPVQFANPQKLTDPNIEPALLNQQGHSIMDTTMDKQANQPVEPLWDSLLIDLSAEFFPTKIPLKQLKQISDGLLVEIGDLSDNKIRLHVEGKTIAHGELVIVGDKFAVRVNEVTEEEDVEETTMTVSTPDSGEKQATAAKPAAPRTAAKSSTSNEESKDESEMTPAERRRARRKQRMMEREARAKQSGDGGSEGTTSESDNKEGGSDDDWLNDDFDQNLGED